MLTLIIILVLAIVALILILTDKSRRGDTPVTPVNPGGTSSANQTAAPDTPSGLIISEVLRGEGGFAEILNNSGKEVELSSFFLSDNPDKADKWQFPEHKLAAGEYCVVNFSGTESEAGASYASFAADFKLNSEEHGVYLFNRGGRTVDRLEFDNAMPEPVAALRSGSGVVYTAFPTRGKANSDRVFTAIALMSSCPLTGMSVPGVYACDGSFTSGVEPSVV